MEWVQNFEDSTFLLNKYFDEQKSEFENFNGFFGPVKKAFFNLKEKRIFYTQDIGPKISSFQSSIKTDFTSSSLIKKSDSVLLGEAIKHWVYFVKAIARLNKKSINIAIQINNGKANIEFSAETEELMKNP